MGTEVKELVERLLAPRPEPEAGLPTTNSIAAEKWRQHREAAIIEAADTLQSQDRRIGELEAENDQLKRAGLWLAQVDGGCEEVECADVTSENCHCMNRFASYFQAACRLTTGGGHDGQG